MNSNNFEHLLKTANISIDSKTVNKNTIFFAIEGSKVNSHDFIEQIASNVLAIVADEKYASKFQHIKNIFYVENTRKAFADSLKTKFLNPPKTIFMVSGTNGKTSVSNFVSQLMEALNHKCGIVGTLGSFLNHKKISENLTTPDSLSLIKIIEDMVNAGADSLSIEASSHGLHQYRLDFLTPTVVGFTNLTLDHLDYHKDFENYYLAKRRLFTQLLPLGKTAIINADDLYSQRLINDVIDSGRNYISYGKNGNFKIVSINQTNSMQYVQCIYNNQELLLEIPCLGEFMVYNIICALLMVHVATNINIADIAKFIPSLKNVSGRMDFIGIYNGARIIVDYAHTPNALENVLLTARAISKAKIHLVFGCGGDRDSSKRPLMGKIADSLADVVIITDDNPRTENAESIREQIRQACLKAIVIPNRATAIATAIKNLNKDDILIIAGKGHEEGQIIGTVKHPFNDKDEVLKIIKI